ncbi:MAG: hypothetical protein U1E73_08325 [Planctomycetota bacterium]
MHRTLLASSLFALLTLAACDNIGRAFDPSANQPEISGGATVVQVVPEGGDLRDGRPKVKTIAPTGGGWPTTVPIAIEFTESVNEASILPTSATATDGKIVLRVKGTTQVLPCNYQFFAGDRVLVMLPLTPLSNQQNPSYEVVLLPDARDADGVRFQVTGTELVLAEFQVNQAATITDGRILLTAPRDNQRDAMREAEFIAVFDRPANAASVTPASFVVRPSGGTAVSASIDLPVRTAGQNDPRVAVLTPLMTLDAAQRYEFVVDDTITFGQDGVLDFRGRTPYAVFDTVGLQAPTTVHVQNATVGYPDKINAANFLNTVLRVTMPPDTEIGDTIAVRIYGGDRDTAPVGDQNYVERTAAAASNGTQDVDVDFTGHLGTLTKPRFDDDAVTFAMQMRRGSQHSAFRWQAASIEPRFDVTAPTLVSLGPPAAATGFDVYTDLEQLVLRGTASEEIAAATLTDGVNPAVELFASAAGGAFAIKPLNLGRLSAPRAYTLTFTDLGGNLVAVPVSGNIVQRGVVTGALGTTLTVEAYDAVTLEVVAGATVLVDPGVPTVPATGQLVGTTDASGRAVFTGLAAASRTVTVIRAGYDLITLYDTAAAFASLPLRPTDAATATFTGSVLFQPTGGITALVGNSAYDDGGTLAVATTTNSPTTIPPTSITAGRQQFVTAFGGSIEPTAMPGFTLHGYTMLGPTGTSVLPPLAPAAPGETSRAPQDFAILTSTGTSANFSTTLTRDLATATGLDTGNLVGGKPIVRTMASLLGFEGQVLAGVGLAAPTSATAYGVQASYGLPFLVGDLHGVLATALNPPPGPRHRRPCQPASRPRSSATSRTSSLSRRPVIDGAGRLVHEDYACSPAVADVVDGSIGGVGYDDVTRATRRAPLAPVAPRAGPRCRRALG